MYIIDHKQFEEIVAKAIDNIPPAYGQFIKNLAFVVEDEPTEQQRRKLRLTNNQSLFGLYEGVPLTKRASNYNLVLPDKITVFKKPIELSSSNLQDLTNRVNETVWHEVAHYYGLGHANIKDLESRDNN